MLTHKFLKFEIFTFILDSWAFSVFFLPDIYFLKSCFLFLVSCFLTANYTQTITKIILILV
jgi:hypothetical protein